MHMLCVHGCGKQPCVQNVLVLYLRSCIITWQFSVSVCVCILKHIAESCMFQYTCVHINTHTPSIPKYRILMSRPGSQWSKYFRKSDHEKVS